MLFLNNAHPFLQGPEKSGFRALIIVPTRELAQQTYREFKKLTGPKKFRACVLTKARANENSLTTKNFGLISRLFLFLTAEPINILFVSFFFLGRSLDHNTDALSGSDPAESC